MSYDSKIGVRFREALQRLYLVDPPLPAFYKRLLHLIEVGEIPQAEGAEMQRALERVLVARGYDLNEVSF